MNVRLIIMAAAAMAAPLATKPAMVPPAAARTVEAAAVRAVLAQYQAAIVRLDARGTERLFTPDSAIFESGGVEGNYVHYLAHHLTPELAEFKAFTFSNYKVDIRFEGPVAIATETYNYRIQPKIGDVAERTGVATSVLKKVGGHWKILSMHNSARRPKAS